MKKSIELAEPSTVVQASRKLRWMQIASPFALSLFVGTMVGAMLGGMFYGSSVDPTAGDFKFVIAESIGIVVGLFVGYMWSRQVSRSTPPEETVTVGMSMLRKYHRNHAKGGLDAEAAQYKLSAEYLKTLNGVK